MSVILFDSQFDDRHRVLRNTKGLTDAAKLEAFIARQSYMRVAELERPPLAGNFDIRHLRIIHQYIFQDIFPWAGDFREVTTSRTSSFSFPPPIYIEPSLNTIFENIRAEDHLKNLDPNRFALQAGHYLGEIKAVHPFREGNGRTQREFLAPSPSTPATASSGQTSSREENNQASRISYATGDSSQLAALIRKRLAPVP